jgi:hypothetical protein
VAKAGYIEVPDAFMERVNPYKDHRLEITVRQDQLIIRKKPQSTVDETLVELYSDRAKPLIANGLIPAHPFAFHVRYYWREKIDFVVVNSQVDATWKSPLEQTVFVQVTDQRTMRQRLLDTLRRGLSQQKRNSQIDLLTLLRCPNCFSTDLKQAGEEIKCQHCQTNFASSNGIPIMYQKAT